MQGVVYLSWSFGSDCMLCRWGKRYRQRPVGQRCCNCGFRDKGNGSFFHWTHRTGWNKETRIFFTSTYRSMLSFSDPCLRISILKHIKIQTSRLTSQHRYLQQQAKTRWRQWCSGTQSELSLSPDVIRKCQNSVVVIYWSRYLGKKHISYSSCYLMSRLLMKALMV